MGIIKGKFIVGPVGTVIYRVPNGKNIVSAKMDPLHSVRSKEKHNLRFKNAQSNLINSYNRPDSFCNPDSRLVFALILLSPKR